MPPQYWPQTALLHDHLDGSRPLLNILPELHLLSRKEYPFDPWASHHEQVKKWFKDPQVDIVKKFSITTGGMQSVETIVLAAKTYVQTRARQGFKYCEVTIAPQYHVLGGLSIQEVIGALIEGVKEGEKEHPKIEVNLLASVGREVEPEKAVELVEAFAECDRNYVVGVGLVCDEGGNPPEKHDPMFRRAHKLGMKTDCHAGEWCHLPKPFVGIKVIDTPTWREYQRVLMRNVYTAVFQLGADRISHAIPLAYDHSTFRGEVLKRVLEKNIPVLGCPGSNYDSGLIPNMTYLGIRRLLELGVEYSIHPDDDLFQPDLDEVFQRCNDEYRFIEEEKKQLLANPWLSRFGNRKNHPTQT